MYKEKFRQKTGLHLLNAVGADDCTDGIDVADSRLNELVHLTTSPYDFSFTVRAGCM